MERCATNETASPILFFDGVCNLCNGAVQFIIRRDAHGRVRFAPLQSAAARSFLQSHAQSAELAPTEDLGASSEAGARAEAADGEATVSEAGLASVICWDAGRIYTKSDAVLHLARYLRQPWPLFSVFRVLPRGLRNALYDIVAKRRYQWFGRRTTCMVPTANLRSRFLE